MPVTIDGKTAGDLANLFATSPAVFFKSYSGGPTNESGPDLQYFDANGYRDRAAEAAGVVVPLDFFVYQDAKNRGFQPFGNFEGDWNFRQRVVRAYWDQPAFAGKYAGRATGLETTVANETAGLQDYAQQQTHGSKGLGDLGILAAVAGLVSGGIGLFSALGSAGASAGLAETAAIAGAAGDAGFIGAAGAAELSGASAGLSLSSAAGLVKNAYSVASGINTLTGASSGATPPPNRILTNSTGNPVMAANANPLYLVNQDTATSAQAAAPNRPGRQSAGAVVANAQAMPLGLSANGLAIMAAIALAAYAFWEER